MNLDARVADTEPTPDEMQALVIRLMRGVNGQAFRLFGDKVVTGPFAGMTIAEHPIWDDGNAGCKMLGSYEFELHDVIEHACWRNPTTVINVGSAEGYYAIGLARRLPSAYVAAIDIDKRSLELCEHLAAVNNARVHTREGCRQPSELRYSHLFGHRLYVIDIEGAEEQLIDFDACPELAASDLIIECHDFLDAKISSRVADKLYRTHTIERIKPRIPDLSQFQFVKAIPTVMSLLIVAEKRPMPCCWLACWTKSKGD